MITRDDLVQRLLELDCEIAAAEKRLRFDDDVADRRVCRKKVVQNLPFHISTNLVGYGDTAKLPFKYVELSTTNNI